MAQLVAAEVYQSLDNFKSFRDACTAAVESALHSLASDATATALAETLQNRLLDDNEVRALLAPLETLAPLPDAEEQLQSAFRQFLSRWDVDLAPVNIGGDALAEAFSIALQQELHERAARGAATGQIAILLGIARLQRDASPLASARRQLADSYVDPRNMFNELAVSQLAGRKWLLEKINNFMQQNDRGYVIIEANAGLGKSTLLGFLALRQGLPAHFTRLINRPSDASVACGNLAAQLSTRFNIPPVEAAEISRRADREVDSLGRLFGLAARARSSDCPTEPIIILIDGLDEVQTPPAGRNPLNLPRNLPPNCYIVVSQRPQAARIRVDVPITSFSIDASSPANLQDMRLHLTDCAREPHVQSLLEESTISDDAFIEALLHKSAGVWIYLHYVLAEVRAGRRTPLSLDELPNGLRGYYGQYWESWRTEHEADWFSWHRYLLATLALAKEPLTADTLAELTCDGVEPTRVRALIAHEWRPFITHSRANDRFELYHLSLRDYVVKPDQRELNSIINFELDEAVAESRQRFARVLLAYARRLLIEVTPEDPRELKPLQLYAVDHVISHLIDVGDLSAACSVVGDYEGEQTKQLRWLALRKARDSVRDFLRDIDLLFAAAARTPEDFGADWASTGTLWLLKLALAAGSVITTAHLRKVEFIVSAVRCGVWTQRRAVSEVIWSEEPDELEPLCILAPFLSGPERTFALGRLLEVHDNAAELAEERHLGAPDEPVLSREDEQRALVVCASKVAVAMSVRPYLQTRVLYELWTQGLPSESLFDAVRALRRWSAAEGPISRLVVILSIAVAFRQHSDGLLRAFQGSKPWRELIRVLCNDPARAVATVTSMFGNLQAVGTEGVSLLLIIATTAQDRQGVKLCVDELERRLSDMNRGDPLPIAAMCAHDPTRARTLVTKVLKPMVADGLIELVDTLPPTLASSVVRRFEEGAETNNLIQPRLIDYYTRQLYAATGYLAEGASTRVRERAADFCLTLTRMNGLQPMGTSPLVRIVSSQELRQLMKRDWWERVRIIERAADRIDPEVAYDLLTSSYHTQSSQDFLRSFLRLAPYLHEWMVDHLAGYVDGLGLMGDRAALCAVVALHTKDVALRKRLVSRALDYLAEEDNDFVCLEVLPLLVSVVPTEGKVEECFRRWLGLAERLGADDRAGFHFMPVMVERIDERMMREALGAIRGGHMSLERHEVLGALVEVLTSDERREEVDFHLVQDIAVWQECSIAGRLSADQLLSLLVSRLPEATIEGHSEVLKAIAVLSPGLHKVLRQDGCDALVGALMTYPSLQW